MVPWNDWYHCTAHTYGTWLRGDPRVILGIAKQYATAQLKAHGLAVGLNLNIGEGIWSKGSHPKPITDQGHYENTIDYIRGHERKGAIVIAPPPLASTNPLQDFDPQSLLIQ